MPTCLECKGTDTGCEWCEGTNSITELVYVEQLEAENRMLQRLVDSYKRQQQNETLRAEQMVARIRDIRRIVEEVV